MSLECLEDDLEGLSSINADAIRREGERMQEAAEDDDVEEMQDAAKAMLRQLKPILSLLDMPEAHGFLQKAVEDMTKGMPADEASRIRATFADIPKLKRLLASM